MAHYDQKHFDNFIASLGLSPEVIKHIEKHGTKYSDFVKQEEKKRRDMLKNPKYNYKPIDISSTCEISSDGKTKSQRLWIDLNDGTHLIISPGMSEPKWKIRFDPNTHEYHTTNDTWCEMIKPVGVIALWRKGKDIQ